MTNKKSKVAEFFSNVGMGFPSRCPHCQSIRTLPVSDEKRNSRYESIWQVMELAEKERKEDKKEVIFEKFVANWW